MIFSLLLPIFPWNALSCPVVDTIDTNLSSQGIVEIFTQKEKEEET